MPYARVGAMPQHSSQTTRQSRQQESEGGSSRKHAITMEDLKKQTAMRLAVEGQQQQGHFIPGYSQQPGKEAGARGVGFNAHGISPYHRSAPASAITPSQVSRSHHYSPHAVQPSRLRHIENVGSNSANTSQLPSGRYPEASKPTVATSMSYPKKPISPGPSQKNQSSGKPKLPHGLTVQELKDMTKARLQAESTDRHEHGSIPTPTHGVSGRDPNASAFTQPHPTIRMSSHPSNSSLAANAGRESWQQTSSVDQAWETASIASMNSTVGSDYLGSESAFSAGKGAYDEVPFGRSRSSPSYVTGTSPFDYAGNRQRSSTMSPRPGLHLSHLHEDRPLSGDGPAILGFDATPGTNLSRNSSPATLWSSPKGGVIGGGFDFNRERTASAPSIPTVLHSNDDPLGRRENSFPTYGSNSLTNTPAAAGTFVMTGPSTGSGDISSVFRETPDLGKSMRRPPGLFPRTTESTTPSSLFESDPGLDTTWGQPSFLVNQALDEAALAKSLGSILQLSGTKEAVSDENTLFSRIDPEIRDAGSFEQDQSGSFFSQYRGN